jgi:hypothetical protein
MTGQQIAALEGMLWEAADQLRANLHSHRLPFPKPGNFMETSIEATNGANVDVRMLRHSTQS